jgi:hypothetical protein
MPGPRGELSGVRGYDPAMLHTFRATEAPLFLMAAQLNLLRPSADIPKLHRTCSLSRVKRTCLFLRCKCPLLTQSGQTYVEGRAAL